MNAKPDENVRPAVRVDWEWAEPFEREAVSRAVQECFVRISTMEEDQKGTDWVVDGPVRIECRMRRVSSAGRYRDFTLRNSRPSGAQTELSKIRKDIGGFYVYAWVDGDRMEEYIVVDMNAFRRSGLAYEDRPPKRNRDGTTFVVFSTEELWRAGCIVAGEKYPGNAVSFRWQPRRPQPCVTDPKSGAE